MDIVCFYSSHVKYLNSIMPGHRAGLAICFCSFALALYLQSDESKISRSLFSFFECKSDSLFVKEQFTLFKISLCSFLKRKLTAGLITAKESKSLFLKRVTRAIFKAVRVNHSRRSFKKSNKGDLLF